MNKHMAQAIDHVNSKHFKILMRCNKCPNAYLRYKAFKEHFKKHHSPTPYKCQFEAGCNYSCFLSEAMVGHYKDKHKTDQVPEEFRPIDPSIAPVLCGSAKDDDDDDDNGQQSSSSKKRKKERPKYGNNPSGKKKVVSVPVNAAIVYQGQGAGSSSSSSAASSNPLMMTSSTKPVTSPVPRPVVAPQPQPPQINKESFSIMDYAVVHKDPQGNLVHYSCKACGVQDARLKGIYDHFMENHMWLQQQQQQQQQTYQYQQQHFQQPQQQLYQTQPQQPHYSQQQQHYPQQQQFVPQHQQQQLPAAAKHKCLLCTFEGSDRESLRAHMIGIHKAVGKKTNNAQVNRASAVTSTTSRSSPRKPRRKTPY